MIWAIAILALGGMIELLYTSVQHRRFRDKLRQAMRLVRRAEENRKSMQETIASMRKELDELHTTVRLLEEKSSHLCLIREQKIDDLRRDLNSAERKYNNLKHMTVRLWPDQK